MNLRKWRAAGFLNESRSIGESQLCKNGSFVDVWLQINGKPQWFAFDRETLLEFLSGKKDQINVVVYSDGNVEE